MSDLLIIFKILFQESNAYLDENSKLLPGDYKTAQNGSLPASVRSKLYKHMYIFQELDLFIYFKTEIDLYQAIEWFLSFF